MEMLIILIICAVVFGFIGMALGDLGGKAQGPAGFLCGALLGPLGCVIAVLLPPAAGKAAATAAPGPDVQTHRKIAAMEAQLAALKAGPKPVAKAKAAVDADATIPTYRLD
jgi:hypothetical protein